MGDKQGAIADYSEAIRINPNYAEAYSAREKEANSVSPSLLKHNPQPYLCSNCTYHLDNTCPISQRPYVKSCNVYQNSPKPIATQPPEKSPEQFFGGPIEKNFSAKQWNRAIKLIPQRIQLTLQTASNFGRLPFLKILSGVGAIGFITWCAFFFPVRDVIPVRDVSVSPSELFAPFLSEYYTISGLKNPVKSKRSQIKPYIKGKIIPVRILSDNKGMWIDAIYYELPEDLRATKPEDVGTIVWLEWGIQFSSCKVTIVDKSLQIIVNEIKFKGDAGGIPIKEIVDYLRSLPKK